MPLPPGTRVRVKTIIKNGQQKKVRLAFKGGKVIEAVPLHKNKSGKWKRKK